jgi:hypothetical protein
MIPILCRRRPLLAASPGLAAAAGAASATASSPPPLTFGQEVLLDLCLGLVLGLGNEDEDEEESQEADAAVEPEDAFARDAVHEVLVGVRRQEGADASERHRQTVGDGPETTQLMGLIHLPNLLVKVLIDN